MVGREKDEDDPFKSVPSCLREIISREGLEDAVLNLPDMAKRLEGIDPQKPIVYPASPLGFAESTRPFLATYIQRLEEIGFPPKNILNPWTLTPEEEVGAAFKIEDLNLQREELRKLNK